MAAKSINVNFVFANYEKRIVASTTTAATGADLKALLCQQWPDNVPKCDDRSRIRLICMGCGFLQDAEPIGPKFPTFEHPTPINVSIRPIGQTTSSITVVSPPKKNEVSRPAGTFIPPAAQPPRITGPGGMVGPPPGARYAAVDNGQQPPGANGLRPGVPGAPGSVLLPTGTPSSDTGRCCTVS